MENKRMAMLVTGNILIETEGTAFTDCLQSCFEVCAVSANPVKKLLCPFLCLDDCKHPTPSSEANLNEIDHTDYFCKLGCVTHRCASSSSIHDKHQAEKVSVCVDSCSDMCSRKN